MIWTNDTPIKVNGHNARRPIIGIKFSALPRYHDVPDASDVPRCPRCLRCPMPPMPDASEARCPMHSTLEALMHQDLQDLQATARTHSLFELVLC
jgi:hypothetical protein